ncbi:hypothetical protein HK099_006304 [Clydaea vesicula]|uniref:CLASP N-terminal domain-containing protein n=1 Tax=Clydaea vesicula TaxID=447962 RepID=A0AAD5TY27_9FUNG|nr:hypothetical protein HK099_006304 [Clydaea vesicula]
MNDVFEQKESEQNWEKFEKELQKVSEWILNDFDILNIKKIKTPIVNSIQSERTRLSRTAMILIKDLSAAYAEQFEQISDIFLPVVLKNCAKANNVYVNTAFETMLASIENSKVPNLLPHILDVLNNANKILRLKATACLVKIMEVNDADNLFTRLDLVEQSIRISIMDRDDKVCCVTKFISSLNEQAKKYLKLNIANISYNNNIPNKNQSPKKSQPKSVKTKSILSHTHSQKTSSMYNRVLVEEQGSSNQSKLARQNTFDVAPRSKSTTSLISIDEPLTRVRTLSSVPSHHQSQPILNRLHTFSNTSHKLDSGAQRVLLPDGSGSVGNLQRKQLNSKTNAKPLRVSRPVSPADSDTSSPEVKLRRHATQFSAASSVSIGVKRSINSLSSVNSGSGDFDATIYNNLKNFDWAVRCKGMERLKEFFIFSSEHEIRQQKMKWFELITIGFHDLHPKVLHTTILAIICLFKRQELFNSEDWPVEYLDHLLPKFAIVYSLFKTRSFILESGNNFFHLIKERYRGELILRCIERLFGLSEYNTNFRLKIELLNFLSTFVVEDMIHYFQIKNSNFLGKLSTFSSDSDHQIQKGVRMVLGMVHYSLQEELFFSYFLELLTSQQRKSFSLLFGGNLIKDHSIIEKYKKELKKSFVDSGKSRNSFEVTLKDNLTNSVSSLNSTPSKLRQPTRLSYHQSATSTTAVLNDSKLISPLVANSTTEQESESEAECVAVEIFNNDGEKLCEGNKIITEVLVEDFKENEVGLNNGDDLLKSFISPVPISQNHTSKEDAHLAKTENIEEDLLSDQLNALHIFQNGNTKTPVNQIIKSNILNSSSGNRESSIEKTPLPVNKLDIYIDEKIFTEDIETISNSGKIIVKKKSNLFNGNLDPLPSPLGQEQYSPNSSKLDDSYYEDTILDESMDLMADVEHSEIKEENILEEDLYDDEVKISYKENMIPSVENVDEHILEVEDDDKSETKVELKMEANVNAKLDNTDEINDTMDFDYNERNIENELINLVQEESISPVSNEEILNDKQELSMLNYDKVLQLNEITEDDIKENVSRDTNMENKIKSNRCNEMAENIEYHQKKSQSEDILDDILFCCGQKEKEVEKVKDVLEILKKLVSENPSDVEIRAPEIFEAIFHLLNEPSVIF